MGSCAQKQEAHRPGAHVPGVLFRAEKNDDDDDDDDSAARNFPWKISFSSCFSPSRIWSLASATFTEPRFFSRLVFIPSSRLRPSHARPSIGSGQNCVKKLGTFSLPAFHH